MRQKSALSMDPAALKIFGKSIDDIMNVQQHVPCLAHLLVPVLVHDTVAILLKHGLSVEGIFRVSGSLKMMEGIVARLNSGELPDMESVMGLESGINVVSGLLKKFLRELPEPLMTFALFHDFVDVFEESKYSFFPFLPFSSPFLVSFSHLLIFFFLENHQRRTRCKFLTRKRLKESNAFWRSCLPPTTM